MSNNDNQKEQKVTNQYALFWNYNANVEHQHNYFGGKPENTASGTAETKDENKDEELPTPAEMAAACEKTHSEGLWWGDTSWSVVYRVYCEKGYKGTVKGFTDVVSLWPFKNKFPKKCNRHSVSRPLERGKITGSLSKWRENGVSEREIKLGERLMDLLTKRRE